MKKFKMIARDDIVNIKNDYALRALDAYRESPIFLANSLSDARNNQSMYQYTTKGMLNPEIVIIEIT